MSDKIIDVLPPYKDEVLVSWIVRMLRMYNANKLDRNTCDVMRVLFGPTTSEKPGLYLQRGLQYFAEHCNVNNATSFCSETTLLETLSVLPFYFSFFSERYSKDCLEKLNEVHYYLDLEKRLGIRVQQNYLEGAAYFKFCPDCLAGQSDVFLQREHQIQGNLVCWKHGCVLKRIPYGREWKEIDFVSSIKNNRNVSSCVLTNNHIETAKNISIMIRQIFENGFLNDIMVLKIKIAHKLHKLKFMTKRGTLININQLLKELNADYLYGEEFFKSELIKAVCFSEQKHPNPIIYLFLINYLFGTLDNCYEYNVDSGESPMLSLFRVISKEAEESMHDIKYYADTMSSGFFREYSILGDTQNFIIVKHLVCGSIYLCSKKTKKLRKCNKCKTGDMPVDFHLKHENIPVCYRRYVLPLEYAKMHGKSRSQIGFYYRENRISGIIKAGRAFLIPEDAPYPKDRRFK